MRKLLATIALGLVLPAPALGQVGPNAQAEQLAQLLTHRPTTVICSDTQAEFYALPIVAQVRATGVEPAGLAQPDEDTIWLSPWVCQHLSARDMSAGSAINTLTHEAVHIAAHSWDEAYTECVAGQNYWPLLHALHLPHKIEAQAYKIAMMHHDDIYKNFPAYDWRGRC